MGQPKTIELHFPAGGLNKAMAFKQQPPYTSPHLMNVRPTDTYLGRSRGGSRPGLAKVFAADLGTAVRLLSSVSYIPAGGVLTTLEVASAAGTFFKESGGNLVTIGGNLTLSSTVSLRSAERLQKIYIADHGVAAAGTDGVVSGGGTTFDSATFSDWTAVPGLNIFDYVLRITSGPSAGVYRISAIVSGTITLTDTAPTGTANTFRLERGPKVYDPATNLLTLLWATAGTHPIGCTMVVRFRDRLLWSGDPMNPNNIFSSAVAAPLDHDYSQANTITTRAWSLIATDAGAMGDPVTALIPHADGCCLVGCTKSLHVIRSDPARTGSIHELSAKMGVVDADASCRTPSGWTYFLSLNGLCAMQPGCGSVPFMISDESLPQELKSIDRTATTVQMEWDLVENGMFLFLTSVAGSAPSTHYFVTTGTENGGNPRSQFFPMQYPVDFEPTSLFSRDDSTASGSKVHLGCRDGYVRSHLDSVGEDDGQPFRSCVTIGPMAYTDLFDGMVKELIAVLGKTSGDVCWSVHVGNTAEEAAESDPHSSGIWNNGLNASERPRARGAWFCLKVSSNNRWTLEKLNAVVERLGRNRL